MPTGYTADVKDGKVTTLRQYALRCARGMGFTILMRDDPSDAPLPEKFDPSTKYHDERLVEARALLAELQNTSLAEAEKRARTEYEADCARVEEWRAKDRQTAERYDAMTAKVESWQVPAELASMKSFMLEQLRTARDFDCRGWRDAAPLKTAEDWKAEATKKAARDIGYHEEERAKEIARTAERNRYLVLLRESLNGAE